MIGSCFFTLTPASSPFGLRHFFSIPRAASLRALVFHLAIFSLVAYSLKSAYRYLFYPVLVYHVSCLVVDACSCYIVSESHYRSTQCNYPSPRTQICHLFLVHPVGVKFARTVSRVLSSAILGAITVRGLPVPPPALYRSPLFNWGGGEEVFLLKHLRLASKTQEAQVNFPEDFVHLASTNWHSFHPRQRHASF